MTYGVRPLILYTGITHIDWIYVKNNMSSLLWIFASETHGLALTQVLM